MKKLNKVTLLLLAVLLGVSVFAGCSAKKKESSTNAATVKNAAKTEEQVSVVATIFPEYDFLRQIGGERIKLSMLLTPGAESHSFEPTPQDIKTVGEANMFVYVGGDSDSWVESILDSVDSSNMEVVTLMDCVSLVEEEVVDGMTPEEEEEAEGEEAEYDEHVWTSPKNAVLIVSKLCDSLCRIDEKNAAYYQENTAKYIETLNKLDQEFREVVDTAKRKEIIVGDRFPFRYFVDEYGLSYYAAFPGCSTDTEASAATIAFLSDKVTKDQIPVIFHIELSNTKICDSICETTGAKSELLNAVHNVSRDDFENGVTYVDMMEHNVTVLKEALN